MHSIIQFVGALVALAGVVVIAFAVMMMVGGQPGGAMAGLSIGAGGLATVLSGAVLYCFGAIVEHLMATGDRVRSSWEFSRKGLEGKGDHGNQTDAGRRRRDLARRSGSSR